MIKKLYVVLLLGIALRATADTYWVCSTAMPGYEKYDWPKTWPKMNKLFHADPVMLGTTINMWTKQYLIQARAGIVRNIKLPEGNVILKAYDQAINAGDTDPHEFMWYAADSVYGEVFFIKMDKDKYLIFTWRNYK